MSNDSASLNSTPAAIAYLNPMQLPRRPGLLTALGIADFLVAAISIVANVGAILICLSLYRLTLPVPKPAATLGPLPLAPSTPIKPYHGDYLPASGLPKESRSAVIEAAVKSSRLNRDRQAMLNRLLAESGKQILGKQSISETVASVARSSAGPDMPSPRNPIVFNFPAGKVEINNSNASFTPADGSTETIITGNFVKSGGRTQYCAVAIDEAVDAVQRRLNGEMNALQAGALAELYRPDGAGLPPGSPLLTPNVFHVSKVAGVPGCQTIQVNEYWIVSTGGVVFKPNSASLDPITGLPRVPPSAPGPTRKPLTLDFSLIVASGVEYLLSAGTAILLVVAGVRLLNNSGDAPRLHGGYVIIKVVLAFANFIIGMLAGQQLVDGGFLPGMRWGPLIFGLIVQTAYPAAIVIVFIQDPVKDFYRQIGIDGAIVPVSWLNTAARLSPDSWGRLPSLIAVVLGVAILLADFYLWSHGLTSSMIQSELFYPSLLGGIVLLTGGCVGSFRLASAPVVALAGAMLLVPSFARAAEDAQSTQQLLDEACAADWPSNYQLFYRVVPRDDAFLPLLAIATDSDNSKNRSTAKSILMDWLRRHPKPDSPQAQDAIKAAIAQWLIRIHAAPLRGDSEDAALVETLADTATIISSVEPWLHETSGSAPLSAIDLIASAKPDNQQKWDALVRGIDDPRTRNYAQQLLRQYKAADREQRLGDMARNNPVPESRAIAIRELHDFGGLMNPNSEAVIAECLGDSNADVRRVAATVLCSSIRGGEIKVVALLHSPSLQTRQAAADALAINSAQEKVLTAIRPPLHDQDPAVRAAAAVAWQKPGRQHPDLVPLDDLVNLLEDADPQVRFQGAWAVYRCQDTAPMLGPYSYPLMHATLFEGHKDNRKEGVLTETPVSPTQNTVDKSVPPYPDADPKTGEVIHPLAPATTAVPAPQLLPKLAQSVSVLAWAALIAAIAGLLAKARLAALPQKPA